ncbi:MAG: amidophosphoribosyltransferase [Planctomycetota bacterium]|nr:MAG: amidophosphoribosyltransferase [Planctomycetota bacterium]
MNDSEYSSPKDSCGLFGVFGNSESADLTFLGLYSLQHRGEEAAGIITSNGRNLLSKVGTGLVSEVFSGPVLQEIKGDMAIGHVRYSTTGSSNANNCQPMKVSIKRREVSIAHNGNITNAPSLRKCLDDQGAIFQTSMDTELLIHLLARSDCEDFTDALCESVIKLKGAFCLLVMTVDKIYAIRDPSGFRPFSLGKLWGSLVLSSETCAMDLIEAEYTRDIQPGEVLEISKDGMKSFFPFKKDHKVAHCIFEQIYFAKPDSNVFGFNVYETRKKLGHQLAKESPLEADMIIPMPDSGNYAALGFAEESGIQFELGMIRNHYIGRTFIEPSQVMREFGVKVKHNPVKDLVKGKRVVVVDDSIVRGTTAKIKIKNLRDAGATEVHMRICCPPHRHSCYYGIDFPEKSKLIASNFSIEEIKKILDLDSLAYLSYEGMLQCMKLPGKDFCTACFNGDYPVEVDKSINKYSLELTNEDNRNA